MDDIRNSRQLQLYTEHTFAYRNHKVVWDKASPMTGEEILALDACCLERFVELVPNQSSFAHLERWLAHKEYLQLAEREDSPFSLSPAVAGSIELLAELYDELLPHFSSTQFNVHCDETFDLGNGKSKEICERLGKDRVYLDFLLKIHKLVQKHNRKTQFWGDIILHNPELISELRMSYVVCRMSNVDHRLSSIVNRHSYDVCRMTYVVCRMSYVDHRLSSIVNRPQGA